MYANSAASRYLLPVFLAFTALAAEESWKTKQIAAWTDDEARDVLKESPWVKSVTPTFKLPQQNNARQSGMGGGRRGGMDGSGMGGIGIQLPGMGQIGRRGSSGRGYPSGGGGYPGGDGYPNGGGYPGSRDNRDEPVETPEAPALTLRWETALPVRAAEMKLRDLSPATDEKHYVLAVYGVPDRFLNANNGRPEEQLKKDAVLKRDGKKDAKASSVEIIHRPEGALVLYYFPMSIEISRHDHHVEFGAQLGQMQISRFFDLEDMIWEGKLEI